MNNHITFSMVKNRLEEKNMHYEVLSDENGISIIVSSYGARIFGPFEDDQSESISWINSAFGNSQSFDEFLKSGDWNIGGDRSWIAPELSFFVRKRLNFDNTYTVQKQIDPGTYSLNKNDGEIILSQSVHAEVYEMPFTEKCFFMKKTIKLARNPLSKIRQVGEYSDIKYFGLEVESIAVDESPEKKMPMENWTLTQLNPGGYLLIPFTTQLEYTNYYTPVDDSIIKLHKHHAELKITGDRNYKLGFNASQVLGRAVYVNRYDQDRYYALIKHYNNNPSSQYCCYPSREPGKNGCSLFIYNDCGKSGGFAEFENSGETFSDGTNKNDSVDKTNYWFYIGSALKIEKIIELLVGIEYKIKL